MRKLLVVLFAATLAGACDDGTGITNIDDKTGTVVALAWLDRDGDGLMGPNEGPIAGVRAALVRAPTGDTVAAANTGADGIAIFSRIAVGSYQMAATNGSLGDTVAVLDVDSASVTVAVGDTTTRRIRVGYPTLSLATVRSLPVGRHVVVEGVALNGWSTFGDSTLHIRDASGAARIIRVLPGAVQSGDSVRIFATTGLQDDRFVLADATAQVISAVGRPAPDSVSTAIAAAATGYLDGQVRIAGAVIQDTTTIAGDRVLGVDDGSGRVEVVLDRSIQFGPGTWVPGATFQGAGVLVPGAAAAWRLKPRDATEASASFPTFSVAEARTLQAGRRIAIDAIALNARSTFGDSSVHIRDATGALRALQVVGNVVAGDSVHLLGTIAVHAGQPVLTAVTASVLRANAGVPQADSLSTVTAASAEAGSRDAAQARIAGMIMGAQPQANGDLLLLVNDGSGLLGVLLDDDLNFGTTQPFTPGAELRATGVLVPTGSNTWQLKPRSPGEVAATFPTVTIEEARAMQPGKSVYVRGVALNSWVAFSDSALHLYDATSAIRVMRLPSTNVFAGDSVRILGTTGSRNGQPVLNGTEIVILLAGVGMDAPDSVSSAVAAAATGAARDADHVRVRATVTAVDSVVPGRLTVNDGSGDLVVVLDPHVGLFANFVVGDIVRVRGVLTPESSGAWVLKPRTTGEIVTVP